MKTKLTYAIILLLGYSIAANASIKAYEISGCSVAGVATATKDSICDNDSTTLLLSGYTGAIQWQSFDGVSWINEIGAGSTTDNYAVTLAASTDFRAMVTQTGCPPDSSNIISIVVGVIAPTTTGATRCGYGQVTVTATSPGNVIKWFDAATGGNQLGTGSSYTTNISSTTDFFAAAVTNGGGSGTTPMPAQTGTFSPNVRGYWFTAPSNFTMTGLFVPLAGATQNIAVLRFNPAVPPPAYPTVTNAFAVLFLTQNNPAVGVIPVNIPINAGDVIGVLAQSDNTCSYASPSPNSTIINGQTVVITRMGMQFPLGTTAPMDIWQEAGGSISRLEITYEVGCESSRTTATATVTPPPAFTITATPPALCVGMSSVLTASSGNPGYNYTWSPPTGLSGTTGNTVIASPVSSITYTVVANDGTCGNIDSIFIAVGAASIAGSATVTSDTLCLGLSVTLFLAGNTGNIQWQSYNGTSWVNETGPGSNTSQYLVSPTAPIQYRAVVTNGGCPYDSSNVLTVEVMNIVDPVTVNDTICGPGIVNLSASGAGALNWFTAPAGGTSVYTGSVYSPFISSTTTYHVEASALGNFNVGPVNNGFGSQAAVTGNDYGLQFDAYSQITIERVYVYPGLNSGSITINLRNTLGGPILNTITAGIVPFSGKTPIYLGFVIPPGNGYRLELAIGSVQLNYNTNGAVFPYMVTGSPVTITGNVDPNFGTGISYYFFYDWEVTEGCKSNRIPVTGVVLTAPPVPTITQIGNQLTSSSPVNNQWNLNGVPIPGATGQIYIVTQPGLYTVTVTDPNGCSSTSSAVTDMEEHITLSGIEIYPNPFSESITIKNSASMKNSFNFKMMNTLGECIREIQIKSGTGILEIDLKNIAAGSYMIEMTSSDGLYRKSIVKY